MNRRRKTQPVSFADVVVGGDAPISVQSMTNTDTADVAKTVDQIQRLIAAGCELIRVAVPDKKSAGCLGSIKEKITIPLIADIHFDHRLALEAINNGVDGLRLNPGNINDPDKIEEIVKNAARSEIPIRVGVNAGSLEKDLLEKYGHPTAEGLVESAIRQIRLLEEYNFKDIIVSVKSSDIRTTVAAYKLLSEKVHYPFHIGVTEAGTVRSGTIKSSIGIGALLLEGLGDTIRVSLTADPEEEVRVAWQILKDLKLRARGPEIISCPGCGRTQIDIIKLASRVEAELADLEKNITVAVMGCAVNGPGEAREADVGIAGGKNSGLIFRRGKVIKKVKEDELISELINEIQKL